MDHLLGKTNKNQEQDLDQKVKMEIKLKIILQLIRLCRIGKTKELICRLGNLKTLHSDIHIIIK